MKKVIFISALAIAAAVSCTKSDIVDTKFNEAISFEAYTGRDAMTKATPYGSSNVPTEIGLYGYYLGNNPTWGTASKANLWQNATLKETTTAGVWAVANDPKYWANDADNYTFLAYAPIATTTEGDYYVAEGTDGENPAIFYTVDDDLANQKDLLYAKKEGTASTLKSGVELLMHHSLARLTVKAKEVEDTDFDFYVKEVKISGDFNVTGQFDLYNEIWTSDEFTSDDATYSFYNTPANTTALTTTAVDYAGTANYLMMLPTTFTTEAPATLYVKYTTFYEGQESMPIEKSLAISQEFAQGKAYSIELAFSHEATPITFKVTVEDWPAEETINGGNPNGDTWSPVTNE